MSFRASPSQLSTWKLCHRKWFYSKVMRLPEPVHPSAALGTEVHSVLENYVQGIPCDPAPEVARILTHIWASPLLQKMKAVGALIEQGIEVEIGGHPLIGRIDAYWVDGNTIHIVDHKTTKDFKWAKSEQDALSDPQTIVYGHWALSQPGIERVVFVYNYIKTASPAAPPMLVEVEHTRASIQPFIGAAASILSEMFAASTLTEHDVERTPEACWAFGGCAFRQVCFASGSATKENTVSFQTSDMSKKLESLFGAVNAAPTPATPAPPTPPKFQPAPPPAPAPPAPVHIETPEAVRGDGANARPVIYFGCAPTNTPYEFLEHFLDRTGFLKKFADGNKGQYYLNSDFNRGPGVVAVDFVTAVHKGTITLPPHLVVPENSQIGRFIQIEQRYLEPKAVLVARSPF